MKLILPNGEKIELDNDVTLDEKKQKVQDILDEWNWYFEKTWNLRKTKICLEVLSNYLCSHKDDGGENDGKEEN